MDFAAPRVSMWKAYLQLFRISNLPTVVADILAGALLSHRVVGDWSLFFLTLLCSSLLYLAGMVLNDYYDVEQDRRERSERPLVCGAIDIRWAGRLGYLLLGAGILVGWLAGYYGFVASQTAYAWRPGALATVLAGCVVAYDGWLKKTAIGPACMGCCRFLNILLGASAATSASTSDSVFLIYFEPAQLVAAGAIGVYILGVTLFAQTEARDSSRWRLFLATSLIVFGIGLLAVYPGWLPREDLSIRASRVPLLASVIGLLITWRCLRCIPQPTSANVQVAVKTCLLSLIILDAVIVLAVADVSYVVGILGLLVPNLVLARWISST